MFSVGRIWKRRQCPVSLSDSARNDGRKISSDFFYGLFLIEPLQQVACATISLFRILHQGNAMFKRIYAPDCINNDALAVVVRRGFDEPPYEPQKVGHDVSAPNVFFTFAWFRTFAETVPLSDTEPRIYCVSTSNAGERDVFTLPMYAESGARGKPGMRKLLSLANYYSGLFGPMNGGDQECLERHVEKIAEAIAAERPRWDLVDLRPLDPASPFHDAINLALRRAGMVTFGYFCHANWYLEVDGRSFDDYYRHLPGRLRNTIERKARALEAAGRLRVDIVTGGDALDAAIGAYETIYRSSWKPQEAYPAFIPAFIRLAAAEGWLRLGVAYIDGTPAAAQIWIVFQGVASIYKLAYDERYSRESIGSVLTARLMRHAIDIDRVREVDFLSGDDAYKKDWMSHRRERHGIMAFNLRTPSGIRGALKQSVRSVLKKMAARLSPSTNDLR